jgi:hypothetical protein
MAEKKVIELEVKTNTEDIKGKFASLKSEISKTSEEVEQLTKAYGENSDEVKQASKQLESLENAYRDLNKVATDVGATFEEVYGDLQPLTTRMGEAEDRLYELTLAGKTNSKEYKDLLGVVGQYKRTMMETDMVVDAAATTMTSKLGGALGGAASAFSAVEGGMALVGVESEDLQATMVKLQAAMALSEGINGIKESSAAFKQLGAIIGQTAIGQKLLTAAQIVGAATMRVLNAVMAANPILLVVGAVGALVAALEILKRGQDDAANKQRELNRQLEYTKRLEKESIDATSEHVNELKKQHENKLRLKQAEGAKDSELTKIEIDNKKEILRYYNLVYQGGAKLNKDQLADAKQLREDIKILQAQQLTDLKEANAEKKTEIKKANKDLYEQDRIDLINQEQDDIARGILADNAEAEADRLAKGNKLKSEEEYFGLLVELDDQAREEKKAKDAEDLANSKLISAAKFDIARNTFSVIGDLAKSFAGKSEREQKRAFNIQKAANIAGAVMDTYKAANGAYASMSGIPYVGPFLGAAAAAVAIGAGIANVNNIRNQEFGGGGSASSAPSSTGSLGGGGGSNNQAITPNFNIIGNQNQTQLAQLNQAPVKAYVVGSDVTTQQMLDKKKIQNATI